MSGGLEGSKNLWNGCPLHLVNLYNKAEFSITGCLL